MTIGRYPGVPGRLAPFLAQWDCMSEQLLARLQGITDEEYLWDPPQLSGLFGLARPR